MRAWDDHTVTHITGSATSHHTFISPVLFPVRMAGAHQNLSAFSGKRKRSSGHVNIHPESQRLGQQQRERQTLLHRHQHHCHSLLPVLALPVTSLAFMKPHQGGFIVTMILNLKKLRLSLFI